MSVFTGSVHFFEGFCRNFCIYREDHLMGGEIMDLRMKDENYIRKLEYTVKVMLKLDTVCRCYVNPYLACYRG